MIRKSANTLKAAAWAAFIFALAFGPRAAAQELFAYSEPASNVPANSIGLRMTAAAFGGGLHGAGIMAMPEVKVGLHRNFMMTAQANLMKLDNGRDYYGGVLYAKYRFLVADADYSHFRMAAFARAGMNNMRPWVREIDIASYTQGGEAGIVATQLLKKTAINLTAGYARSHYPEWGIRAQDVLRGSLSVGRLMLPTTYTGFKQTNLNLMLEAIAEEDLGNHARFADLAGAAQLIFNSRLRVDIGYRAQLYASMTRMQTHAAQLRVEYTFLNALTKRPPNAE